MAIDVKNLNVMLNSAPPQTFLSPNYGVDYGGMYYPAPASFTKSDLDRAVQHILEGFVGTSIGPNTPVSIRAKIENLFHDLDRLDRLPVGANNLAIDVCLVAGGQVDVTIGLGGQKYCYGFRSDGFKYGAPVSIPTAISEALFRKNAPWRF